MADTQGTSTTTLITSSHSDYAIRRKQHLALINQLRAIGAQADLDLPRIAVIGNQSAGKSGLVEAISGISVPRDAGTCTRCPMECRLASSSESWSCQIYIRWEFDVNGIQEEQVEEVSFGPILTDKEDVELSLRRAQAAVLNPGIDQSSFLDQSESDLKQMNNQLKFSRNAVCLDLSGPDLTDLAFVDLPGIIQNADPETVLLVEDLVTSNIKGNCLILVTLPMSDDIENQKAARLAKQEDPSGVRTIGVMTKPDTLPLGATKSRDLWLDVVEGRRFPLHHGYYCTRQPDDDERARGITAMQSRAAEKEFFAKTAPWSNSSHRHRFGIGNLVANLSRLLTQIINDTLPKLQNEVTRQLAACDDGLSKLPPAITTDPPSYILTLITEFCNEVKLHVKGGNIHASSLIQSNHQTYAAYKRDIRCTAPIFLPFPNAEESGHDTKQYTRLDDSEEEPVASRLRGRVLDLNDVRERTRKSRARELPNNVPYVAKVALIEDFQSSWEVDSRKCFSSVVLTFERALNQLLSKQFLRYDVLGNSIAHAAMDLLRCKQDEAWFRVQTILDLEKAMPFTQNSHYLQVTKDKNLSLYKAARANVHEVDDSRSKLTMTDPKRNVETITPEIYDELNWLHGFCGSDEGAPDVDLHGSQPVEGRGKKAKKGAGKTLSRSARFSFFAPVEASVSPTKASDIAAPTPPKITPTFGNPTALASATSHRQGLADEQQETLQNAALSALAALGIHVTAADLGKLHPPDIYEEELEVMAEVRAYFQVAYKRVIDYVPMTIDNAFLFAFAESLQTCLIEKLGLGSPNYATRCAMYLSEDPSVVARRDKNKKARLNTVQNELFNFGL